MLADLVGAPNHAQSVARSTLERAGLSSRTASPFSGRWASCLDPTRAKEELGFRHEPLTQYLDKIITACLSHPPAVPPDDYVDRANEIELGLHLRAQGCL